MSFFVNWDVCSRTAARARNRPLFSSFRAEPTEKKQPCKESPRENKSSFSPFPWPAAASASCGGGVWDSLMLHRKGKKWHHSVDATAWWRSLATLGSGAQPGDSVWGGWLQRCWTLLKETEEEIKGKPEAGQFRCLFLVSVHFLCQLQDYCSQQYNLILTENVENAHRNKCA